jgi:hypothetical protein
MAVDRELEEFAIRWIAARSDALRDSDELGRGCQLLQPGLCRRINQRGKVGPPYNLEKLLFGCQRFEQAARRSTKSVAIPGVPTRRRPCRPWFRSLPLCGRHRASVSLLILESRLPAAPGQISGCASLRLSLRAACWALSAPNHAAFRPSGNARSRTASARGRPREMLDLDRAGSLLGSPEIILQLQLPPAFRRTPVVLREPNDHVRPNFRGGNSRMPIEQR